MFIATNNKKYFQLLLTVLLSFQAQLFAQNDIVQGEEILAQEYIRSLNSAQESAQWSLVNKANILLKNRLKRKGLSVFGIRAANSLLALSYTGVTLNTLYQLANPELALNQGVFQGALTSVFSFYFGMNAYNAKENYDQRSLRKIFRELKKTENKYLLNLKDDLAKLNIELVDFKNNVNSNWDKFYKYGKPSFTLVLRTQGLEETSAKVAFTYEPKVTYSKKGKILRINFNKSVELAERAYTEAFAQQDHLRRNLNVLFEGLKDFNVCDYFLL